MSDEGEVCEWCKKAHPESLRLSDMRTSRDCGYMLTLRSIEEDVLRPVLEAMGVRLWDVDTGVRTRMAALLDNWRVFGNVDHPFARIAPPLGESAMDDPDMAPKQPFRGWVGS